MKNALIKTLWLASHRSRSNAASSTRILPSRSNIRAVVAALVLSATSAFASNASPAAPQASTDKPSDLRIYTLDCGRLDFTNLSGLADTGDYAGKSGSMAVPCFLIKHDNQWMLWDAGLGDEIARIPGGRDRYGFHWTVERTLRSQLKTLGLTPEHIDYVGLSHVHADHVGNVGLFPKSTFLVGPAEFTWGLSLPTPPTADRTLVALLKTFKVKPVPYDLDVFGDGSVVMLRMPGHSPGHHCLMVRLPRSGVILFSGDLYHTAEAYAASLVPVINDSRADTLASMLRFKKIASAEKARVVIQHSPEEFSGLPKFPAFLD